MTHFRAMVISDDYEKALEPYCESDKNYFEKVDCTSRYADKTMEELEDNDFDIVTTDVEEQVDTIEKQDYARFDGDKLVKAAYFCHPNARYDYYGDVTYYNGDGSDDLVFKKEYEHIRDTNEIRLKYIDFPATLEKEKERRRNSYRRYVEILGHVPNFKTWDMLKKEYGKDFSEKKENRDFYWEQPDVKAYNDNICSWGNPDEYMCTEQEYVDKTTYPISQIVTDNEWIAEHEVGWWAVTYGHISTEYNKKVDEALAKIDPETNVYIMDCHI